MRRAAQVAADRELLRRIVEHGMKLGVQFRTEASTSTELAGSDCRFIHRLTSGRRVRQIRVSRDTGGIWADRDVSAFLAGAANPLREAINIAHELGHDQSAETNGDEYADKRDDVEAKVRLVEQIGQREADLFYGEEWRAWKHGRSILKGLRFEKWSAFYRNRRSALKTNEEAIRPRCPGWAPRRRYD